MLGHGEAGCCLEVGAHAAGVDGEVGQELGSPGGGVSGEGEEVEDATRSARRGRLAGVLVRRRRPGWRGARGLAWRSRG